MSNIIDYENSFKTLPKDEQSVIVAALKVLEGWEYFAEQWKETGLLDIRPSIEYILNNGRAIGDEL